MASADVYTSHGGGGVGEAYTCDTPVLAFRDACAVCVWLEKTIHSALCSPVFAWTDDTLHWPDADVMSFTQYCFNVGPALKQHWVIVTCLLGLLCW